MKCGGWRPGLSIMASCALLAPAATAGQAEPYTETIAGTTVTFDMVPVAGAVVTVHDPEAPDGSRSVEVAPFWIGKTEVTWDEFDVWMLGLDLEPAQRSGIDAESRPSRPYGAPDRGFGHAGFAAISVTYEAAARYAEWLSEKTGHRYRLPTWAEWRVACLRDLGLEVTDPTGPGGGAVEAAGPTDAEFEATLNAARRTRAWHGGNADNATHAVASKEPGALGLYDMLGNAGEWVTNPDGDNALHGGTYRDDPAMLTCSTRAEQEPSWNERDPQIPKSSWWLSDGPFAGFRLVREDND